MSLTNLYHTLYVECNSSFIRIPTCSLFSYVNPTITTVYNFFYDIDVCGQDQSHCSPLHLFLISKRYPHKTIFSNSGIHQEIQWYPTVDHLVQTKHITVPQRSHLVMTIHLPHGMTMCNSSFIRIPTCSLFSYVNPTITTVYNFFYDIDVCGQDQSHCSPCYSCLGI
jgi:hypothetical protein